MGLETIAEHTEKIKEIGRLLGRDLARDAVGIGFVDLDRDLFDVNMEGDYAINVYWRRDNALWLWVHVDEQSDIQWEFFTNVERNQLQLLRYIYAGLFNVQYSRYKNEG